MKHNPDKMEILLVYNSILGSDIILMLDGVVLPLKIKYIAWRGGGEFLLDHPVLPEVHGVSVVRGVFCQ